MKLARTSVEEFNRVKARRPGKAQLIVQEFIDSGEIVMRVDVGENEYTMNSNATSALNVAIASMNCGSSAKAVTKDGVTYLYNPREIDA